MPFKVVIQPSLHQFEVEENETILDGALKHGFVLPYGCREGACGACMGKVLQGRVDHGDHLASALSDAEKAAGMVLFCCAKPLSDLVIESHEVRMAESIPVRTMPCRVEKMEKAAEDVMILKLKLPANERLQFFAGQYISILMKDGKPRSFSLANPPHQADELELHIRRIEGGVFTSYVFTQMKARDILRFRGPLGTFFLREDSDKPIILVASGTGFAPVNSIVEHALHAGLRRPMHFYWGGRKLADLYLLETARQWERRGIKFTPVLSAPLPSDNWQGRTGLVHQAVLDDYQDLSGYEVYACGAPVMVQAAHRDYKAQRRLPEDAFYSDMFTFAPKT